MAGSGVGLGGAIGAMMPVGGASSGAAAPAMGGGKGGGAAATPVAAPTQGQFAPLTPQGDFNVNQASAAALQQAMQGTQAGMGFQPMMAGASGYGAAQIAGAAPITAQGVQAGQIAGTNLGAYTNPYESQVVGTALGDIERSRQMAQNQLGAQATAARAFGGSRQGIAEAETNRAFAEQAARTATGLRQAGFQQAQQLAGQDIATRMQAGLANQQASLTAQQATAASQMAAQQANLAALNQARQFGATAANQAMLANQAAQMQANQQRLGAAAQLGGLGQQAFQTGQTIQQSQAQQGLLQQQLQQALIDAARGQYQGYVGSPAAALGAPLAALGAAPTPQSTTQTQSPGLLNYLQAAAMFM